MTLDGELLFAAIEVGELGVRLLAGLVQRRQLCPVRLHEGREVLWGLDPQQLRQLLIGAHSWKILLH